MGYKGRDIEVVEINTNQYIVIACDSCGAIGEKEYDIVKVPYSLVGRLTARVALIETISAGASPKTITAAICNEPSPAGEGIIKGIKDELKSIGIEELPMAISTEKNMKTEQTSLGITVVGICEKNDLRVAKSAKKDFVYCLGIPKVGNEIKIKGLDDFEIIQGKDVLKLMEINGIHDIIPVGSRGILGELEALASNVECSFHLEKVIDIDINKSAGPSTCLIFTSSSEIKLSSSFSPPLTKIGILY